MDFSAFYPLESSSGGVFNIPNILIAKKGAMTMGPHFMDPPSIGPYGSLVPYMMSPL